MTPRCTFNEVHEISDQTRALMPGKDIVLHSDFLKNLCRNELILNSVICCWRYLKCGRDRDRVGSSLWSRWNSSGFPNILILITSLIIYVRSQSDFFSSNVSQMPSVASPVSKRKEQLKLQVYSLHLSYVYSGSTARRYSSVNRTGRECNFKPIMLPYAPPWTLSLVSLNFDEVSFLRE